MYWWRVYSSDCARIGSFSQASARISALVSLIKFLNTGSKRFSTLELKKRKMLVFLRFFLCHTLVTVIEMTIWLESQLSDREHMNRVEYDWRANRVTKTGYFSWFEIKMSIPKWIMLNLERHQSYCIVLGTIYHRNLIRNKNFHTRWESFIIYLWKNDL